MYVSIHEYAETKLRSAGAFAGSGAEGEQATWARHGAYFAESGTEEALAALNQHGGVVRSQALALDLENLMVACRRAVARGVEWGGGGDDGGGVGRARATRALCYRC